MNRNELFICLIFNLLLASLFIGAFIKTARADTPYLTFVIEYWYCPLLDSNPHGRLNLIVDISKLMYDGSSTYDWYFYSNIPAGNEGIRIQTVPGCVAYGSNWETAHTYANHTVWDPGEHRWLVDYDPTTTDGFTSSTATATVSISPEGSGISFSLSYTYNIPYVKVIDKSDFSVHRAFWEHDFNEQNDPGGSPSDSTYLARPAFVVKTTQNSWTYIDGQYKVDWGHPVWFWWEYESFKSDILYLDAKMGGDTPITQNDAGTGGDAGNSFADATSINEGSYEGTLYECVDEEDWYKFYVQSGQNIYVRVTPPSGVDFDLQLYDPGGNLKAGSYKGSGYSDSVSYTADSTGYWRARIYIFSGEGQYSFYVNIYWPGGGGGCPILYVYNGTDYICEGLLNIHNSEGVDVTYEHTLISMPHRVINTYLFKLIEHPQTHSYIDQVKLYAILNDKTVIQLPLIQAWHSEYGNVLPQLLFSDEWKTNTIGANLNNGTSQSITLKFLASFPVTKVIGFIFQIEGNNPYLKK